MATVDIGASSPAAGSQGDKAPKKFHGRLKIDTSFCPEDVDDPFDTVEWDLRTAPIKGEGGEVLFEQNDCEVPSLWSQLATNVVVSKYFYGEVGTPERENSVRQLIHRVDPHDRRLGHRGRLLRHAGRRRAVLPRADLALPAPARRVQLAGLVQRRPVSPVRRAGATSATGTGIPRREDVVQPENPYEYPARLGLLHPERRRQHGRHHGAGPQRGDALQVRLGHRHRPVDAALAPREALRRRKALGPLSFMRVYDQIAAVVKSGGKTRRAAKMQSLKVWHPDVMEFIECKRKEEKKARLLIEQGVRANFNGEAYSSVLFQNANLSVRVTDEFMEAVEADEPWTTRWVTDDTTQGPTYQAREMLDRMAEGAWHCGDPGVQYDTTINRWHTCPNSRADQRLQPVQRVHVPRRLGLQPGEHQPDEVPPRRRHVRRRAVPGGLPGVLHRPGDPGRSRQLSDRSGSPRNSHLFRPLGLGYSNLGSLLMAGGLPYDSDEARGAVRRDHRAAARGGQPDQRRAGRGRRAVRRLRGEPRADAARDADASRRGRGDRRRRARRTCKAPPASVWDEVLAAGDRARLPQRPGHGAGPHRHDQLHDGLRHDGHRARHRPGEVQAARRRRHAEDRQPDGAAGPRNAGLQPSRRSSRSCDYIDQRRHDRRAPRPEGRAPAGVRLCVQAAQAARGRIPWKAHVAHDGGRPAVPLRGDLARRSTCPATPRPRTSPRPTSRAGGWASRRWRSTATARRTASR